MMYLHERARAAGRQLHVTTCAQQPIKTKLGGAARTGEQRGVGYVVGLHAGGAHAAEHLLRGVGAPARAARRHERRVRDHVGRAPRVARRRRLHLAKHLHGDSARSQGCALLDLMRYRPGIKLLKDQIPKHKAP